MWMYINSITPSEDGNYFCAKYEYNPKRDGLIYTYGMLHYDSLCNVFTQVGGKKIFDNVMFWTKPLNSAEDFVPLMI